MPLGSCAFVWGVGRPQPVKHARIAIMSLPPLPLTGNHSPILPNSVNSLATTGPYAYELSLLLTASRFSVIDCDPSLETALAFVILMTAHLFLIIA